MPVHETTKHDHIVAPGASCIFLISRHYPLSPGFVPSLPMISLPAAPSFRIRSAPLTHFLLLFPPLPFRDVSFLLSRTYEVDGTARRSWEELQVFRGIVKKILVAIVRPFLEFFLVELVGCSRSTSPFKPNFDRHSVFSSN